MLILDKQKAVEHMVALMATGAISAIPEELTAHSRGRTHQKVARYERRPAAAEDAPARRRSATRTRASMHPANGIAPV